MSYLFILLTVLFTVYGQVVIKWQIVSSGAMPAGFFNKLVFLLRLLLNPWIMSGFTAAFLAALCWMAAMTKLDLSHAYRFVAFTFVLVMFAGALLFNEPLNWQKVTGMVLIVLGIIIGSQG